MNANPTVDVVLRRYLLGTIDPEVREDVERRLFADDRIFWEQLCLAEDELIDDYVSGDLDDDEVHSFERCFLTTEERREKVAFARALRAHVESERAKRTRAWRLFDARLSLPAWVPAAAALLIVVLPALTWRLATHAVPVGNEVTAELTSGLVRSGGAGLERVQIPRSAGLVRLRLESDAKAYPSYRAALSQASGEEIWSQNNLIATDVDGERVIVLTLPADLLPTGDYYVSLRGVSTQNDVVALDRYDFRVLRDER